MSLDSSEQIIKLSSNRKQARIDFLVEMGFVCDDDSRAYIGVDCYDFSSIDLTRKNVLNKLNTESFMRGVSAGERAKLKEIRSALGIEE